MELSRVKLNADCVIKSLNIAEEKIKFRLMELGIVRGAKIQVKKKSLMKKTMLVVFNNSCFTLKENLAQQIMVNYV